MPGGYRTGEEALGNLPGHRETYHRAVLWHCHGEFIASPVSDGPLTGLFSQSGRSGTPSFRVAGRGRRFRDDPTRRVNCHRPWLSTPTTPRSAREPS